MPTNVTGTKTGIEADAQATRKNLLLNATPLELVTYVNGLTTVEDLKPILKVMITALALQNQSKL